MFQCEMPLNPPVDHWNEYLLPQLAHDRVIELCEEIVRNKDKFVRNKLIRTEVNNAYDVLYEYCQAQIEEERWGGDYE